MVSLPPADMASPGVQHEVQRTCSTCPALSRTRPAAGRGERRARCWAEQPPKYHVQIVHNRVEID